MEKASRYGRAFDRGQCGGVGGCPMMAWALDAQHTMPDGAAVDEFVNVFSSGED